MKILDTGERKLRWPARLLLLLFALLVITAGLGLLQPDFLRRVKHDPKGMLLDAPKSLIHARLHAPPLDEIHFHMKFKNYEKILAKREEALRVGLLFSTDEDEVPAELEADGETIPVKMRLKGDWPDHFETDKWSFRVKTKKGTQYHGMRRFSVQAPWVRQYLGEWLFLNSVRREGILAPRYDFVRLSFNGKSKGIYAVEEHFSKELLESQDRAEAPIAKFDEDPHWEQRRIAHDELQLGWFDLDHLDFETAKVSFFQQAKLEKDPILRNQMEAARHLLQGFQRGELKPSEVFDVKLMAHYIALCRIWGADHSLIWHNLRFYYNPVTARLEPIAFDGEPWGWSQEDKMRSDLFAGQQFSMNRGGWYPWVRRFLAQEEALREYMKALWEYSDPTWSSSLMDEYGRGLHDRLLALHLEWPELQSPVPALLDGQRFFRGKLKILVALSSEYQAADDSLELRLDSVCDVPSEILGVKVGDESWELPTPLFVPAHEKTQALRSQSFRVPLPLPTAGDTVKLVFQSFALPATRRECTARPAAESFEQPAILPEAPADPVVFAGTKPWLRWDAKSEELLVLPGEWQLEDDLILPAVPTCFMPGVTLKMKHGAVILARARLDLAGTENAPVRLLPQAEDWGGLILSGADSLSSWSHLLVQATTGVARPGWDLSGGVTVYESPVAISDCRFEGHRGEDALHLVRCDFSMKNSVIGDCHSDALDGDFVRGTVLDCSFHDVGGDALDLSGSVLDVRRFEAVRISDKAISAGEETNLRASELRVENASIGAASKDLSRVILQDGEFRNTKIGLAAYVKKPVYGPASLEATHLSLPGAKKIALVQTGCTVTLDGRLLETSDFDVAKLYASHVLGN